MSARSRLTWLPPQLEPSKFWMNFVVCGGVYRSGEATRVSAVAPSLIAAAETITLNVEPGG